jgi:glycerol-3-phosphate dehydrogenase
VLALQRKLEGDYPFLSPVHAARLIRAYGTQAWSVLGAAKSMEDLGRDYGATLTHQEIIWLVTQEYARSAQDVVWRRSKLGLRLNTSEISAIDHAIAAMLAPNDQRAETGLPLGV